MNTLYTSLKTLACGMGALAITAVISWSLIASTATVSAAAAYSASTAAPTAQVAKLTIQQRHVWFGQSQPAVLVD